MEEENKELTISENKRVMVFSDLKANSNTKMEMMSNIKDTKELYNLENTTPDALLNDCEGEKIRVKKAVIKKYEKPLKDVIYDETTGEILKDHETTMSIILIDEQGKTYATGSKSFGWQLIRFLRDYNPNMEEGIEIEIVKNKISGSGNKTLGFKLV